MMDNYECDLDGDFMDPLFCTSRTESSLPSSFATKSSLNNKTNYPSSPKSTAISLKFPPLSVFKKQTKIGISHHLCIPQHNAISTKQSCVSQQHVVNATVCNAVKVRGPTILHCLKDETNGNDWIYFIKVERFKEKVHTLRRKARHFVLLEERIRTSNPGCIIPPLPDLSMNGDHTDTLRNNRQIHILKRTLSRLTFYLKTIMEHPIIGKSYILDVFLKGPCKDEIDSSWGETRHTKNALLKVTHFCENTLDKICLDVERTLSNAKNCHSCVIGQECRNDTPTMPTTISLPPHLEVEELWMETASKAIPMIKKKARLLKTMNQSRARLGTVVSNLSTNYDSSENGNDNDDKHFNGSCKIKSLLMSFSSAICMSEKCERIMNEEFENNTVLECLSNDILMYDSKYQAYQNYQQHKAQEHYTQKEAVDTAARARRSLMIFGRRSKHVSRLDDIAERSKICHETNTAQLLQMEDGIPKEMMRLSAARKMDLLKGMKQLAVNRKEAASRQIAIWTDFKEICTSFDHSSWK